MSLETKPSVRKINNNDKIWNQVFKLFNAKVYVPETSLPGEVINFGYSAPYFVVLTDQEFSDDQAFEYAAKSGLGKIAANYASSVVFINPLVQGGWKNADEELYKELISNTKIHQYHEDGIAVLNNRFFKSFDGYAIRGAIYRCCLIAQDDGADYVATKLLKAITGDGLWGPADIVPAACVLKNLSVKPEIQRKDMPIVSIENSDEINSLIKEKTDYCFIQDKMDLEAAFKNFIRKYKRWGWVGDLLSEPDFEQLGMKEEFNVATINISADNDENNIQDKTHQVGYISYYNEDLFAKGPSPLLLCFHGGGDSAKHIAQVSEWYKVCHDHNFLLVCVENHISSTATEMMELLEILKKQYQIDSTRIYASGFSMGGIKTWDMYQEYPDVFAALAPMCATYEPGLNVYGKPSVGFHKNGKINSDVRVPLFYAGGEKSPLPELPKQADKCCDRLKYVFEINKCNAKYEAKFEEKESWKNPVLGIDGDYVQKINDESRGSVLTLNYFNSEDGNCYTVIGSVDNQEHECRYHTCEYAWRFISHFRRLPDGSIESSFDGGKNVSL